MLQAIASVMIILLLAILIGIFLSYYNGHPTEETITFLSGDKNVSTTKIPNDTYLSDSGEKYNYDNLITSIYQKDSGDNVSSSNEKSGEENENQNQETKSGDSRENAGNFGEVGSGDSSLLSGDGKNETDENSQSSVNPSSENLVISSNAETSNQEKQEVLGEIDAALKGLLEAVSKVEVVDERRLDAILNSGVGAP